MSYANARRLAPLRPRRPLGTLCKCCGATDDRGGSTCSYCRSPMEGAGERIDVTRLEDSERRYLSVEWQGRRYAQQNAPAGYNPFLQPDPDRR